MYYYSDARYCGAPDECDHHWPIQLVDGYCPVKDCPESRESKEQQQAHDNQERNQ